MGLLTCDGSGLPATGLTLAGKQGICPVCNGPVACYAGFTVAHGRSRKGRKPRGVYAKTKAREGLC